MFNNLLPKSEKGSILVLFLVMLAVAVIIAVSIYHTGRNPITTLNGVLP